MFMENTPEYLTFIDVIKLLGGASAIIISLSIILGKILINRIREQDRSSFSKEIKTFESKIYAELDSLKAKNEPKTHVHKIQFEKEFTEYQELWSKAVKLDKNLRSLKLDHPHFQNYDDALESYFESYSDLTDFSLNSHPFYFEGIHSSLVKLILKSEETHERLDSHALYLKSKDTEEFYKEYDEADFKVFLAIAERELGEFMSELSKKNKDQMSKHGVNRSIG